MIKFPTKVGIIAYKIHRRLDEVYCDSSAAYSTVAKWEGELNVGAAHC